MYKISILIPCYNCEKWIKQSIQSALDQSYLNKEIVVIDDGSTDSSQEIIKSFEGKIKYEIRQHEGPNSIRNRLLEIAEGEWLQYLDADDYLLPNKVKDQIDCLYKAENADVLYSPVIIEEFSNNKSKKYTLKINKNTDFITNFISWGILQTSGLLWKKDTLINIGRWKIDQNVCQEHELILRYIMAKKKFVLCNKANSVYRIHNGISISRINKKATIHERMKIIDQLEFFLRASCLLNKENQSAINASRFGCARDVYSIDKELANELISKIKSSDKDFIPYGVTAPLLYRFFYMNFGFNFAEYIAFLARKLKFKKKE